MKEPSYYWNGFWAAWDAYKRQYETRELSLAGRLVRALQQAPEAEAPAAQPQLAQQQVVPPIQEQIQLKEARLLVEQLEAVGSAHLDAAKLLQKQLQAAVGAAAQNAYVQQLITNLGELVNSQNRSPEVKGLVDQLTAENADAGRLNLARQLVARLEAARPSRWLHPTQWFSAESPDLVAAQKLLGIFEKAEKERLQEPQQQPLAPTTEADRLLAAQNLLTALQRDQQQVQKARYQKVYSWMFWVVVAVFVVFFVAAFSPLVTVFSLSFLIYFIVALALVVPLTGLAVLNWTQPQKALTDEEFEAQNTKLGVFGSSVKAVLGFMGDHWTIFAAAGVGVLASIGLSLTVGADLGIKVLIACLLLGIAADVYKNHFPVFCAIMLAILVIAILGSAAIIPGGALGLGVFLTALYVVPVVYFAGLLIENFVKFVINHFKNNKDDGAVDQQQPQLQQLQEQQQQVQGQQQAQGPQQLEQKAPRQPQAPGGVGAVQLLEKQLEEVAPQHPPAPPPNAETSTVVQHQQQEEGLSSAPVAQAKKSWWPFW